ncbi:12981_t:CDS:2 [Entrophospora sp. SA101]|nr:12981_t:CDS:2 [Entrophospora sp. SA101]
MSDLTDLTDNTDKAPRYGLRARLTTPDYKDGLRKRRPDNNNNNSNSNTYTTNNQIIRGQDAEKIVNELTTDFESKLVELYNFLLDTNVSYLVLKELNFFEKLLSCLKNPKNQSIFTKVFIKPLNEVNMRKAPFKKIVITLLYFMEKKNYYDCIDLSEDIADGTEPPPFISQQSSNSLRPDLKTIVTGNIGLKLKYQENKKLEITTKLFTRFRELANRIKLDDQNCLCDIGANILTRNNDIRNSRDLFTIKTDWNFLERIGFGHADENGEYTDEEFDLIEHVEELFYSDRYGIEHENNIFYDETTEFHNHDDDATSTISSSSDGQHQSNDFFSYKETHWQFYIGDQRIPLDTTIYAAIHWYMMTNSKWNLNQQYEIELKYSNEPYTVDPNLPPTLDCKVIENNKSTLELLKLLHWLYVNMIEGENYQSNLFIFKNMDEVLNEKLKKPIAILTGVYPLWVYSVFHDYRFLVSGRNQLKLFKAQVFGIRMYNERDQDISGFSKWEFNIIKRLLPVWKDKEIQTREKVFDWALKQLEKTASLSHKIKIKFKGLGGVGLGVTRDFFTILSEEFFKKNKKMWINNSSVAYEDLNENVKYDYGIDEIEGLYEPLVMQLKMINSTDEWPDFYIPSPPAFCEINFEEETDKTAANFQNIFIEYFFNKGVNRQINWYKTGFEHLFPFKYLKYLTPTPAEFTYFFCGRTKEDWKLDTLKKYIQKKNQSPISDRDYMMVLRIMSNLDMKDRKQLLRFATGSTRFPIGGWEVLGLNLDAFPTEEEHYYPN